MATGIFFAGALRHRAKLFRRVETRSAADGEVCEAYSCFAVTRAALHPLSGREFFQAGAGQAELTARIVIRYRDDVTEKDRVEIAGKTYSIAAPPINVEGRGRVLHLMVTEGVSNG